MTPDLRFDPPWLTIARAELGQAEVPGPAANPRIVEYGSVTALKPTSDEVPWCSDFICWCIEKAGLPSTKNAAAASWMNWGTQAGAIVGAIGVIQWDNGKHHVTIVTGRAPDGRLVCLGGNQDNAVRYSVFNRARFIGFRWPALPLLDAVPAPESTR